MAGASGASSLDDNASLTKPVPDASDRDGLTGRPASAKLPRPRWMLHLQAQMWRILMGIGMYLHRLAPPHPPKPAFIRSIPVTLSGTPGEISLLFYTPLGYDTQKKLYRGKPVITKDRVDSIPVRRKSVIEQVGDSIKRKSGKTRRWGAYPVVINFHGGGFTLGTPSDDARWCGTVVDECQALVISVDYRLAPEHPFPTAVEDGVDAVVWVYQHAEELGIDRNKIALSGFSSGGNMTFTVPLRLWDEMTGFARDEGTSENQLLTQDSQEVSASSSTANITRANGIVEMTDSATSDPGQDRPKKTGTQVSTKTLETISDIAIKAIVPWYPSLDYTRTREHRRATSVRKDQDLPAIFTDLFDESYLHPPNSISLDSPYLSPGVAPDHLLRDALPQDIIMHTCQWDMLLDESKTFHQRLISPPLSKNVFYKMIEGVPHGWDKAPNPWKPTPGVKEHYLRACKELRRIFGPTGIPERQSSAGPTAAPRDSVQFVR